MKPGNLVQFVEPAPSERGRVFLVLEDRGDRVLVGITNPQDYGIAPTFCYLKSDLEEIQSCEF